MLAGTSFRFAESGENPENEQKIADNAARLENL